MVSKYCNDLAFDIWSWAVKKDIWLSASHVPGVENNIADLKSRYFYDNKEWSLNPYMFEKVCEKFGKPEIDLFATCLNAKCELYVSFKPEPNAFVVDAFTQNWNDIKGYGFPPFSLIGRILAKIKWDEAFNNSNNSLLANPAIISSIPADGGTRHSISSIESMPQTATVTRNRAETSIMEKTTTNSGTFVRCFQMEGLSSGVSEVIMASWRPGTKGA